MTRILFTGGRSPATLALLRLFAHEGYHCQVAESQQPNLAGASRYCAHNHLVPPPRQQTPAFIARLSEIIREQKIDLLIPTCEESFYVSRYARELRAAGAEVLVESIDVLTNLHSKYQFNQLLRALKLPAAATEQITDRARLKALLPEWGQYVLKPEFSRFASRVLLNAPLKTVYENIQPCAREPWVLQEFLEGPQFCSYSLAQAGRLSAHSVYPTRYAMGQGATIYFESVDIPEIERTVKALVQSLNYTGQISFDFILHKGLYYPIECNPRTTTGTFLFTPEDHLPTAFLGQPERVIRPLARQPVSLTFAMLVYGLPQSWKHLNHWFQDLWRARDPLLELSDLSPALTQFPLIWQTMRQARKHKTNLMAASTLDIEWNGSWDPN